LQKLKAAKIAIVTRPGTPRERTFGGQFPFCRPMACRAILFHVITAVLSRQAGATTASIGKKD
jgi:hypothetical protein